MNEKTEVLLNRLNSVKDEEELKNHIKLCGLKREKAEFSKYILEVCKEKGLKKSDIIKNSDIYRTYGYQILSGEKVPSRDKVLQICIGNNFSIDETNRALKIANMSVLYVKDARDSIMIYSIRQSLSLLDTNVLLDECRFNILGDL